MAPDDATNRARHRSRRRRSGTPPAPASDQSQQDPTPATIRPGDAAKAGPPAADARSADAARHGNIIIIKQPRTQHKRRQDHPPIIGKNQSRNLRLDSATPSPSLFIHPHLKSHSTHLRKGTPPVKKWQEPHNRIWTPGIKFNRDFHVTDLSGDSTVYYRLV